MNMKAAVFHGAGEIEVTEVPIPEPGPGEVLVKVHYCGICGSDVEAYQTGMYEPGLIIGHEFAGEIAKIGPDVGDWSLGERVTAGNIMACGKCSFCRQGNATLCPEIITPGVTLNGAMAEFICLPEALLYRLPEGLSLRHGALVEPLAVVLHGVRSSTLKPGDRVLVMGAGTIGLLALQCANLAGAREVFVSDINAHRTTLAKQLGAAAVFNPLENNLAVELGERTDGEGPELVFICTAVAGPFQEALSLVRKGGEVVVLGICVEPVETDFMSIVLGELAIKGAYLGHGTFPAAIGE